VKSNASKNALGAAREDLAVIGAQPVPLHLRDASYQGARKLKHGDGYLYPHDFPDGYVAQDYLPRRLPGMPYYEPADRGVEKEIGTRLKALRRKAEEVD
jgi:putative ATPase